MGGGVEPLTKDYIVVALLLSGTALTPASRSLEKTTNYSAHGLLPPVVSLYKSEQIISF